MASRKPMLQHVTLSSRGRPVSASVTITEVDGSPPAYAMYDRNGVAATSPVSSSATGLLEVFSTVAREVLVDDGNGPVRSYFVGDMGLDWLNVEDFAAFGEDIADGVTPAQTAFVAAMTAAVALGRRLRIGPGTFLFTSHITVPDYLWMEGCGPAKTILKHGSGIDDNVIRLTTTTGARLARFKIDGNYALNKATSGAELSMGGTANVLEDIEVANFNAMGFALGGVRNKLVRCVARGVQPGSYTAEPTLDAASAYGFVTPASYCTGLIMEGCYATGMRSAGCYVGGTNITIDNLHVDYCHRGLYGGFYGGQVAIPATLTAGGGAEPGRDIKFTNLHIGTTDSPGATGFEAGTGDGIVLINPVIESQPAGAATFNSVARVRITQGNMSSNASVGLSLIACASVVVIGTDFLNNPKAIELTGANDFITLIDLGFHLNVVNWTDSSTPAVPHLVSHSHREQEGDLLPRRFEGTPTTTGTGGLGALAIAKAPVVAAASADLTLTGSATDVTGMSASLTPGWWEVHVAIKFNEAQGGGTDLGTTMIAQLATSGGTATISNSTAAIQWTPQAANEATTISRSFAVLVSATTTAKVQGSKSGGTGTGSTAIKQTHSTMECFYKGNP